MVVVNLSDKSARVSLETGSDIAPRAYVSCYVPGNNNVDDDDKSGTELLKVYGLNAPVLTRSVSLDARDCLILTWPG